MQAGNITYEWSFAKKLVFRLCTAYFVLYVISLLGLLHPFAYMAGKALHLPEDKLHSAHGGSGDTTYHYLLLLSTAVLTPFATLIWSLADRKRTNYTILRYWVEALLRYTLAIFMLIYGCSKVGMLQFRQAPLHSLLLPYGDCSPMGLAWRFMGYSYAFNLFTGLAEVTGGLLLLLWRTRIFGALFSMTVLANVVAMNFCFDIPVKIFSGHLFLMAVFIASSDISRLAAFFTNKPVAPSSLYPLQDKEWLKTKKILKVVYGALLVAAGVATFISARNRMASNKVHPTLYGIYDVQTFIKNNQILLPIITDTTQWRQLIIEGSNYAMIRTMSDKKTGYDYRIDTNKHTIYLRKEDGSPGSTLNYQTGTGGQLQIWGRLFEDSVHISLLRKNEDSFELTRRGFHWINEYPHNR